MSNNDIIKIKVKINNKLASVLIFTLVCILFFTGCSNPSDNDDNNQSTIINNSYKATSLSLTAVGDVMAHTPQLEAQHDASTDTYSFDNNFQHIKSYI